MAASQEEVYERVKEVLTEQLGVDESEITPEASFQEDLDADSLDLVELIMEPPDTTRIYHLAGTQHVQGAWPTADAGYLPLTPYPSGQYPLSPVMVQPAMRALFAAMESWLRDGT